MARNYYINGETMVKVQNQSIGTSQELGLSDTPISIQVTYHQLDIRVDAMGGTAPPEVQHMSMEAMISMTLIHFDNTVLDACIRESHAGATFGTMPRAGTRLGGNVAIGATGNHFITLGLTSPVGGAPWRFPAAYLYQTPFVWPLGTERSIVQLRWRAIPYTIDPQTANGVIVWDNTAI